jgi:hypothetical protein
LPLVPGTQLSIYEIVSLIGSGWMGEVFNSTRSGGVLNLFLRPADGSGEAERLATSDAIQVANSCSPDSRMLMYQDGSPSTGRDIWVWSSADRKSSPWLRTPDDEGGAMFSRTVDGSRMFRAKAGRRTCRCARFPEPAKRCKSPMTAGADRSGQPTGASCSTVSRTVE